jgi:hypothetical protein
MSEEEKKKIAQRLSARVSTGLSFVEDYLYEHERPDAAWIRNIYILLSFYTELLLKAIYVAKGTFANKDEVEQKLIRMGHNLESIGKQVGSTDLQLFGIKSIKCTTPDYFIETNDGNFRVEDFIDIRYDFIEGKVRNIPADEHEMFKRQIEALDKANTILKPLVW